MTNFQKRIITSIILLFFLIIINFTKLFGIGVLIICGWICIEFSEMFTKLVGGGLIKSRPKNSYPDKFNFKYWALQLPIILYMFVIFGGSANELHGRSGSPVFFLYVLSICFLSDIGGYFIGKLIGGKKLTKISPNKTISGSCGSFIFSVLPFFIFYNFYKNSDYLLYNNILFNISSCLYLSLVCQLGDLFVSYFKRLAKVKDTGKLLPGHGGLLDRIDGIIFALPSYLLFGYFYFL